MKNIPSVDLSDFLSGDPARKQKFIKEIGEAYEEIGFVEPERFSNNKLRSTIHRVVNPPREDLEKPRYSIPFFTHPISEMKLNCLPEYIDELRPKVYDDITAGEFLNERLIELGLIK